MKVAIEWVLLALILLGVLGIVGPGGSLSAFSDEDSVTASFTASTSLDSTPPGKLAYDDANENGRYDEGESSYTAENLVNFNDSSVNLVIPSDVDEIRGKNTDVSIKAASVHSSAPMRSGTGDINITATNGDIDLTGTSLYSKNWDIVLNASQELHLNGTDLDARRHIRIYSNGDIFLDTAELRAKNGNMYANLTMATAMLHVDGMTIEKGGPLVYDPDSITVDPSASSNVSP